MAKRTSTDILTNLFQTGQNKGIGSDDLRDLTDSMLMPFGRAHMSSNASETTINTIDTFEIIAGTFVNGSIEDMTFSATGGRLTYTGTPTRHFHIVSNLDMTAASNNQTISFAWFLNGTTELPVAINQRVGTGSDVRTLSVHSDSMLDTNDFVELKVTNRTSTANVTVSNAYFFVMGMFV